MRGGSNPLSRTSRYWHNRPSIAIMWFHALHEAYGALPSISLFGGSHLFGHDPFVPLRSRPIRTPSVTTHSHPFGSTRSHLFGHDPFASFRSRPVHIAWIMIRSYLLDHDTFVPLRSRHVYTSWITTRLYLLVLDHDMFVPLGSWYDRTT